MTSTDFSNALRNAVERDKRSQREISREVGIPEEKLSQFKRGTRNLPMDRLFIVADVLGLKVKLVRKKRPKRKRASR